MGASQFLNVHQERAVAVNVDHLAVRKSNLCSDRGWKTESHGSESRRGKELSRTTKAVILACPHLVLSDTFTTLFWFVTEKSIPIGRTVPFPANSPPLAVTRQ